MTTGRLDYVPGDSFFHRTHVMLKITIMLCILVLMFGIGNIWVLTALLLVVVGMYKISNIPWGYFKSLRVLVPALLVFLITAQALWYSGNRTPLFEPIIMPFRINFSADQMRANALTLYREGFLFGIVLSIRMLGMFLTFPLIFLTTPTSEFIAGLTEAGLPYQIAFIFTTAFRFVPFLIEGRERVMDAQKLRGIELEKRGLINAVKQTVPTIVPMIVSSLRMTSDLEVAIESRAFGAFDHRVSYRGKGFSKSDKRNIITMIVGTIILVIALNMLFPGRGL